MWPPTWVLVVEEVAKNARSHLLLLRMALLKSHLFQRSTKVHRQLGGRQQANRFLG